LEKVFVQCNWKKCLDQSMAPSSISVKLDCRPWRYCTLKYYGVRMIMEDDMRFSLSKISPRFDRIIGRQERNSSLSI